MDALNVPDWKSINSHLTALMHEINAMVFSGLGNRVLEGPFAGMLIPQVTPWDDGNASTKLLGCYEHELWPAIKKAVLRHPEIVVNVGCAEGYYAIGLAMVLSMVIPNVLVYAVDINEDSLDLCLEYARLNGVAERIVTKQGYKTAAEMDVTAGKVRQLFLLDCESAEIDLLKPDECPMLRTSDIIVECHDFLKPGCSTIINERFSATHDVEKIEPQLPRFEYASSSLFSNTPPLMTMLAVTEKRPLGTVWLACWAKQQTEK